MCHAQLKYCKCANPSNFIVKMYSRLAYINKDFNGSFTGWQPAHWEAGMLNIFTICHPVYKLYEHFKVTSYTQITKTNKVLND